VVDRENPRKVYFRFSRTPSLDDCGHGVISLVDGPGGQSEFKTFYRKEHICAVGEILRSLHMFSSSSSSSSAPKFYDLTCRKGFAEKMKESSPDEASSISIGVFGACRSVLTVSIHLLVGVGAFRATAHASGPMGRRRWSSRGIP
jgi:hypothetical protein